jgi:hypothetical protein
MRAAVLILILVNVALFGYARLDRAAQSEAGRLQQQVDPDRIKLLSPQQVAALGPAKVAALADVCVEWGPFADADRARAQADIEPLALGRLVSERQVPADGAGVAQSMIVVRDPPQPAVARLKELQGQYAGTDLKVGPCPPTS